MGTTRDKLNHILTAKGDLTWLYNNKMANSDQSYTSYSDTSSFLGFLNNFCTIAYFTRMKLVPVMTDYTVFCYGSIDGNVAYYNQAYYHNPNYDWLNTVVDPYYSETSNTAPMTMSRADTGVITGKMSKSWTGSVYNIPFVMGVSIWSQVGSQSDFNNNSSYACLSYYYPDSGDIKILIADDSSRNDGLFLLGNIALIDPYQASSKTLANQALFCVSSRVYNDTLKASGCQTGQWRGLQGTLTKTATGRYTVTFATGYNEYKRFWPVIQPLCSSANVNMYASLKKVTVTDTSVTVTFTTADDTSFNDACFRIYLFASKHYTYW